MADDCFLQTRKPSVSQNYVSETKSLASSSENMLMLSEPLWVLVICILFLDFARLAIGVPYSRFGAVSVSLTTRCHTTRHLPRSRNGGEVPIHDVLHTIQGTFCLLSKYFIFVQVSELTSMKQVKKIISRVSEVGKISLQNYLR